MEQTTDQKLDELLVTIKDGFDGVSVEFNEVKTDIKDLKGDVKVLKEDVKVLKEDVKVLKDDMRIVKSIMPSKDFVSDKNADLAAEIGKRINSANTEQRAFTRKLVEFLKLDGALKTEHVQELEEMLV